MSLHSILKVHVTCIKSNDSGMGNWVNFLKLFIIIITKKSSAKIVWTSNIDCLREVWNLMMVKCLILLSKNSLGMIISIQLISYNREKKTHFTRYTFLFNSGKNKEKLLIEFSIFRVLSSAFLSFTLHVTFVIQFFFLFSSSSSTTVLLLFQSHKGIEERTYLHIHIPLDSRQITLV